MRAGEASVRVEEREKGSPFGLFSPSSLENLSYTLNKVSPFLDPKSLSRFSCTSKTINERGTGSNKLWKSFLNPLAQSQLNENAPGAARQSFQRPENQDVKYLTCDEAGQAYLTQLQTEIRAHITVYFFFQECVQRGTLTNELLEAAKRICHVSSQQQALLKRPGVLKLIQEGHISVDEVLSLADQQWRNLQNDKICDLIVARHLSVQAALALTAEQCQSLSICAGLLSLEETFALTREQLGLLSQVGTRALIRTGVLSVEEVFALTPAQCEVLNSYGLCELIIKGVLSREAAFALTPEQLQVLNQLGVPPT